MLPRLPGDAPWSENNALISGLTLLCKSPDEEALLGEALIGTFFSNQLIDLFKEPLTTTDPPPMALASHILEAYEQADEDTLKCLSDSLCAVMDDILTCCRALVAISSGEGGPAMKQDEQGEKAGSYDIVEEYTAVRTALLRNAGWRARLNSYWTLGVDDERCSGKYWELAKALDAEPTESLEVVKETVEFVRAMQKKLRAGACAPLCEKLEQWAVAISTSDGMSAEVRIAIVSVVSLVDPGKKKEQLQTLAEGMMAVIAEEKGEVALKELAMQFDTPMATTQDGLQELAVVVKKCVGVKFTEHMKARAKDFCGMAQKVGRCLWISFPLFSESASG